MLLSFFIIAHGKVYHHHSSGYHQNHNPNYYHCFCLRPKHSNLSKYSLRHLFNSASSSIVRTSFTPELVLACFMLSVRGISIIEALVLLKGFACLGIKYMTKFKIPCMGYMIENNKNGIYFGPKMYIVMTTNMGRAHTKSNAKLYKNPCFINCLDRCRLLCV